MFSKKSCYNFNAIVLFACLFKQNLSERRISGGQVVEGDRRYMVYFLKSNLSLPDEQGGWTCGGAIVTKLHILTSAACLSTFEYIYAIAGYRRYVNADLIDMDTCTSKRKKKVVKTCVPDSYQMDHTNVQSWANVHDIGLAVVESPYDFNDDTYMIDCSYAPGLIAINFGRYAQAIGNDVVELGWGDSSHFKMPYHLMDHNEEFLREASTVIVSNTVCQKNFYHLINETGLNEKFICTMGKGAVDSEGNLLEYDELLMGCSINDNNSTTDITTLNTTIATNTTTTTTKKKLLKINDYMETTLPQYTPILSTPDESTLFETTTPFQSNTYYYGDYSSHLRHKPDNHDSSYDNDDDKLEKEKVRTVKSYDYYDIMDKKASNLASTIHQSVEEIDLNDYYDAIDNREFTRKSAMDFLKTIMEDLKDKYAFTSQDAKRSACRRVMHKILRRQSICQNDHGSPLVSWLGDTEVVIGVAITNIYNELNRCLPPNLFVSTIYHPFFIECSIEQTLNEDDDLKRRCTESLPDTESGGIRENEVNWEKNKI
ncbi:uncharacterized protein LOC113232431 [Hyposmocoma kahamanoa]|uniref:uncharacterized protein LOC113232431 n=1 Tax=Hyposmocoma kahamanoa TaxID=1477025 RepID=UPI000E6D95DB|nr:uncharacterized protein LOC113232431 [Hyposmocoma kahamanoa]